MRTQLLILVLLLSIGLFGQNTETLKLDWKQKKGWKKAFEQEGNPLSIIEYIKKRESLENWTELVAIQKLNIPTNIPQTSLETIMEVGFTETKKNAPEAKLTFIDKNENLEFPWIEYKVEISEYKNDPNPESQLYHVVHGQFSIFFIWWSVKKNNINEKEISEWKEFFETAKIIEK